MAHVFASVGNGRADSNAAADDQITLRAAIQEANESTNKTYIFLPAGTTALSVSGTGNAASGDLDITKNVAIFGTGAGLSIINIGSTNFRILDVGNLGVLTISRVTLALGQGTSNSDQRSGAGVRVQNDGVLHMDQSAVVGNETGGWGLGGGIYFAATASGSIESTIIANNTDSEESDYPDIYVGANRMLDSLGNNRFISDPGGPGDYDPGDGDHVGPVHYVVTSVADTYDGSADPVNMSLRDAIRQANITAQAQEIWLPAWEFRLTLQGFETGADVSIGDLDVTENLTIRGIDDLTKVDATAISDAAFDQIGGAVLTLDDVTVIN